MTEELVHERPLLWAVLPPDKDLAVIRARREHVAKLWVGPRDPPDWSVVANELCSLMRLLPVDDFVDLDAPVAARGRQLLAKVVELHVVDQLRLCSRAHLRCRAPRGLSRRLHVAIFVRKGPTDPYPPRNNSRRFKPPFVMCWQT